MDNGSEVSSSPPSPCAVSARVTGDFTAFVEPGAVASDWNRATVSTRALTGAFDEMRILPCFTCASTVCEASCSAWTESAVAPSTEISEYCLAPNTETRTKADVALSAPGKVISVSD